MWHQGETDAGHLTSKEQYYNNLSHLLSLTRERFAVPRLPFICGGFVKQWQDTMMNECALILAAMRCLAEKDENAAFIETDDLESNDEAMGNGDIIHFSTNALDILGKRYYDAFAKIVSLA